MRREINISRFHYLVLFITIVISGFPYFSGPILLVPFFSIVFAVFIFSRYLVDNKFVFFFLGVFVLTLVQNFLFDFFSLATIIGLLLKLLIAYFVVRILGDRFILAYINILYYLSLISLVIYFAVLVLPGFSGLLMNLSSLFDVFNLAESEKKTILIYNVAHLDSLRNSGPFWEPGAFAGYLIIAFIFCLGLRDKNLKKKGIVIFITVITTLSTTAFFSLLLLLFVVFNTQIKNRFIKFLMTIGVVVLGIIAFSNFDFLGSKVEAQFERSLRGNAYSRSNSDTQRFLNIRRDLMDIEGYELSGRGWHPKTRYKYNSFSQIRTVGLTDVFVKFGIPFSIVIFIFLYQSLVAAFEPFSNDKWFYVVSFVTILITLMSEVYFNYPLYWCLVFLQFIPKDDVKRQNV